MGAREIHPRLDLQWLGPHTVPTSGKKSKNPRTASEHQEVNDEKTKESHGGTYRQTSARIVWHPRGGRAVLTYTGRAEGNNPEVARYTDLTKCLQDWGAIIKHMVRHTTQFQQLVNNLPH